MYSVVPTNRYKKSLKHISQHKDFCSKRLDEIVRLLKSGEHLVSRYRDHELSGKFACVRECHIQDDILLMYRKENNTLVLLLVNIGTHSSLFK